MNYSENIFLAGLDEAGRGPLAGPVSASCVILPKNFPTEILNDSKKLSEKKRNAASLVIKETACWGIAFVNHDEIDKINILQASLKAMKLAYEMMMIKFPNWILAQGYSKNLNSNSINAIVDGNFVPEIDCQAQAIVKADSKFPCVMAASILAKVERDKLMCEYDKLYPQYGYAKHKGYPTAEHKRICHELGPSPIQRLSFKY